MAAPDVSLTSATSDSTICAERIIFKAGGKVLCDVGVGESRGRLVDCCTVTEGRNGSLRSV